MSHIHLALYMAACLMLASADIYAAIDDRSIRVGDTVDVLEDDSVMFHIAAFTTPNACRGGLLELREMHSKLSEIGPIDMTLYVTTRDRAMVREMQTAYRWPFATEIDPLMAYRKAFGVVDSPWAIITDRNGVVMATGPLGKVDYDWVDTISSLRTRTHSASSDVRRLRERARVSIAGSGPLVAGGLQRHLTMIDDTLAAVVMTPLARLALVSTSGSLQRMLSLSPDSSYAPFIPIMAASTPCNAGPVIIDSDPYSTEMVMVDFDRTGITRTVTPCRPKIPAGAMITHFTAIDTQRRVMVATLLYTDSVARGSDRTSAVAWDLHTGEIIASIDRDSVFEQADLSNYFWQSPWIDDSTIAVITNLSTTIRYVDRRTPTQVRTLNFLPDTNIWHQEWRSHYRKLTSTSTLQERMALAPYTSQLERLLRDEVTGSFYVTFYNTRRSGEIDTYIVGPVGSPTSATRYIGRDHLCHRIAHNVLTTTQIHNGLLDIVTYDLR